MYAANYHRPSTVEEAAQILAGAPEGKYVAGGMTMIPTMKQRLAAPSDIIDLRHIESMKGITVDGRKVRIGAATTHAEVASSAAIKAVCPALCHLAGLIGDPHVRHMGTIGGSIANNDPAADYPAGMLGLGTTIIGNGFQIAADDFFTGLFETALMDGQIITAIEFEAPETAGYEKFPNPASRYAMTGVFVSKGANGVRVAVTGAGSSGVFRHGGMETALAANWSPAALDAVSVDASDLLSDLHGSAEYRANLVKVMAKRAVAAAR
ncbi:xanthine dehydrogenase family protein subunit M [Rhizobiaceae bacterium n13]|uniref:Xanthine dehydrogenase family protein subunit M n=1 Tax=Ferirhizobium litorale TaxID=2927786 RepID=A0AAE3QGS0_9HYPH|nr:xanthine dehydrogenase family protein subunit M [Fererhizobium litorale]MDI7862510.1 xanthine dehydrogenase family protein subunit M [Fererhizobium litorale]MDI7923603.1 xanthine dehydrogenase family protein subunit M [Fererhizobium litorale]